MAERHIGILGGTFDPVHVGHLAAAEAALASLELEAVWFMPAASPPHKNAHADGQPISPLDQRVAMLELALEGRNGFVLSQVEAERREPSYSVDTLRLLHHRCGPDTEFFFLVGMDAFAEINTWKDYERLPFLARLVVISRPPHDDAAMQEMVGRHYADFEPVAGGRRWRAPGSRGEICLLTMPPVEVSSTAVRKRRRQGESIQGMVPDAVARYIERHDLYRG